VYIYGSYRKIKTGVPFFLDHPVYYYYYTFFVSVFYVQVCRVTVWALLSELNKSDWIIDNLYFTRNGSIKIQKVLFIYLFSIILLLLLLFFIILTALGSKSSWRLKTKLKKTLNLYWDDQRSNALLSGEKTVVKQNGFKPLQTHGQIITTVITKASRHCGEYNQTGSLLCHLGGLIH